MTAGKVGYLFKAQGSYASLLPAALSTPEVVTPGGGSSEGWSASLTFSIEDRHWCLPNEVRSPQRGVLRAPTPVFLVALVDLALRDTSLEEQGESADNHEESHATCFQLLPGTRPPG
jgi:hypothetical protein